MVDKMKKIKAVWDATIEHYMLVTNEPFPYKLQLEVIPSKDFIAQTAPSGSKIKVIISTGILDALTDLWRRSMSYSTNLSNDGPLNSDIIDQNIGASSMWLILHELHHYELGHFKILDTEYISKTSNGPEFGLVSRAEKPLSPLTDIDRIYLQQCLELQADHEAIDMLLESYSTDEWKELRQRIACISAMMVLIDVEDTKRNLKQSSHPKSATRIFQLLGHVSEMPLVPAQAKAIEDDQSIDHKQIPSEKEEQAFVKKIAIPAFYDAIALANAAGAKHIIDELGDLPAFFEDVYLAKTSSDAGVDQFKTQGAKEWCQLKPINERILKLQNELGLI